VDQTVVDALMQPGHLIIVGLMSGFVLSLTGIMWKWMFPKVLAKELANGAGTQIHDIVKLAIGEGTQIHDIVKLAILEANKEQEQHLHARIVEAISINDQHLKDAFDAHEKVEEARLAGIEKRLESRGR
jgi:hypothetical protein